MPSTGESAPAFDAEAIQHHVDECDRCRVMVAEAVRALSGSDHAGVAPFRTLRDGQLLLGRYRIERYVAHGGMGEVYEAFDNVLGETVALKTLLPTALDDGRAGERVLEEVRLARRVTHSNVCRILEFGLYHPVHGEAGVPFLTMEFLNGEPLSRRIAREGRLAPPVVAKLVREVVAGIGAIHHAGIVHRDFKSENVFLVNDRNVGERAVVMDFGLARGLHHNTIRTSSMGTAGTPDYMAPEQVEGKPPTPAFDIYALGIVIFEMLTAKKPFEGASPYLAALNRLKERAPAPSRLVPGLPPAWDAVVGRCLERRPERRFQRVEEIVTALEAAPSRRRLVRPWVLRGAAVLAVGATIAIVGLPRARSKAEAPPPVPPPVLAQPLAPPAAAPLPVAPIAADKPMDSRPPAVRHRRREPAPAPAPPDARALLATAKSLLLEGELARACETGEQAARLAPRSPDVALFLGRCYVRLGKPALARAHYRVYLEVAPDAPDAVFVRGILGGQ
jgi:tRNA A-37 threonylcarbamoyl transferase component Bud32